MEGRRIAPALAAERASERVLADARWGRPAAAPAALRWPLLRPRLRAPPRQRGAAPRVLQAAPPRPPRSCSGGDPSSALTRSRSRRRDDRELAFCEGQTASATITLIGPASGSFPTGRQSVSASQEFISSSL